MTPAAGPDELAELPRLRATLLAEYHDGRRQRLYPVLANGCRRLLEDTRTRGRDEATRIAGYLLLQAVVTHTARRSSLAAPLARDLAGAPAASGMLNEYLEVDVSRVYAETQLQRGEMHLPPPLRGADAGWLGRLANAATETLRDLPSDLWDLLVLSSGSGRRGRAAGDRVVVVPPREGGAWPEFPAEVAVAATGDAVVVDAGAERLGLDETVAAVFGARPKLVALAADRADEAHLRELLHTLRSACPEAALVAFKAGASAAWLADRHGLHAALDGPPFATLEGLLSEPPRGLLLAGDRGPFPDVTAWPLACYRRGAADADILIPVAGRRGAGLAADLTATCRREEARVRLLPCLTTAQATDLAAAMPRPAPPAWSLSLDRPELPGDPQALRRAGLTDVELRCCGGAIPLELIPVVAAALRDVGVEPVATVDTTGWDPSGLPRAQAELAGGGVVRVTWQGELAEQAAERWRAGGGAA